jgi:hypothetical protein
VVRGDGAELYGEAHQPGDIVYIESLHQLGAMSLDRLDAEVETAGDIFGGVAFGDELENFSLAGSELIERPGLDAGGTIESETQEKGS